MFYNKNDVQGINSALDAWITREDGSIYDDGYSFEEIEEDEDYGED